MAQRKPQLHFTCMVTVLHCSHVPLWLNTPGSVLPTLDRESREKCLCHFPGSNPCPPPSCCPPLHNGNLSVVSLPWLRSLTVHPCHPLGCPPLRSAYRWNFKNLVSEWKTFYSLPSGIISFRVSEPLLKPSENKLARQTPVTQSLQ